MHSKPIRNRLVLPWHYATTHTNTHMTKKENTQKQRNGKCLPLLIAKKNLYYYLLFGMFSVQIACISSCTASLTLAWSPGTSLAVIQDLTRQSHSWPELVLLQSCFEGWLEWMTSRGPFWLLCIKGGNSTRIRSGRCLWPPGEAWSHSTTLPHTCGF